MLVKKDPWYIVYQSVSEQKNSIVSIQKYWFCISDFVLNFLRLNTLPEVLNRKGMQWSQSLSAWVRGTAGKMVNNMGAVMSPWFTPFSIAISPDSWRFKVTQAFIFLCSFFNIFTKADGHPILASIFHNASLLMVSKALIKSTKTWYRGFCCSICFSWICRIEKIMPTVPLPDLKPFSDSGITLGQILSANLLSRSLANTFPTNSRMVILQWWSQMDFSPLPLYRRQVYHQSNLLALVHHYNL